MHLPSSSSGNHASALGRRLWFWVQILLDLRDGRLKDTADVLVIPGRRLDEGRVAPRGGERLSFLAGHLSAEESIQLLSAGIVNRNETSFAPAANTEADMCPSSCKKKLERVKTVHSPLHCQVGLVSDKNNDNITGSFSADFFDPFRCVEK